MITPVSPPGLRTDLTPAVAPPDDLVEDTRSLEAPDPSILVAGLVDLATAETAALADDAARLADVEIRSALATWDALHQTDAARRHLELAAAHPLAPRLRLVAALGDPRALDAFGAEPTTEIAIEVAEAWIWRHHEPAKAVPLLDLLLARELPAAIRAHVSELAVLVHTAAGDWPRVLALRVAANAAADDDGAPDEVAATAALQLDRSADRSAGATAALATCWEKLEHYPGATAAAPNALGWLRCFDIALGAAAILDDERRFELLDQRAELLSAIPGGAREALATRFTMAAELDAVRDYAEAQNRWAALAEDPEAQAPGAARRVALLRAAWSAAATGDLARELAARKQLASPDDAAAVAGAHAWRALELAAVTNDPSLGDLARAVADATTSPAAERWLDVLDLRAANGPNASTLARFEARKGLALRWAAAIAEIRHEPQRAMGLWRASAAVPSALGTTRDHLIRLHRGGDDDDLAAAYGDAARGEKDDRVAAALWIARGVVDLAGGDFVESEEALQHAADLAPTDPFARAALAAVYRVSKRYDQLARTLDELSRVLASKDARAQVAREHAELLDEYLGDRAGARAALERLVADRPDDAGALLALAKLCDRDGLWARAVELRRLAAPLAAPGRRGEIWIDIAKGEEQRGETDAALAALAEAGTAKHPDALREQARIHREGGRLDRALELVRQELASDGETTIGLAIARRMELQTELARLLTELDREPEAVVAAYLDVLSIEPDQTEALAGIEAPARALGYWDELARAFRGAPQTPRNLEVLAEALAKIAEWSELSEVRRRQLEAAQAPAEKAQRAGELAALYEQELGDLDGAIRMLHLAQQLSPVEARQQDLLRLLRAAGRWADVTAALERELPTVAATNAARQVAILLELGELRANKLEKPAEAAQAYEGVLERNPAEPTALAALERLYEQLGRDRELARLLEARAESETGEARAALLSRVGALRANRNDVDGAIAAYTAAFAADAGNRDIFTAMERVCYKAERWAAAMLLYESAIAHVESGASRAYRLGDLYARRGNVQLSFLGQIDAAIASYQKVIEVDSQPSASVSTLEAVCRQRGDWTPLIVAYERRAEHQRDPQRKADALRSAAQLAADQQKDARTAMRLNQKLLAIDPADTVAAAKLERFFEDQGDSAGLVDVLKVRLGHAQGKAESVEVLKKIARASEDGARDVDGAIEHYLKILELSPDNRDSLDALGRIYESTEQWAEFIDITRKQIKVTNDRTTKALLYFRCGSVMEAKFGREQDAIRYYDAAIKTSPSCLPAVHGLRDLYRRREEWPRVIETLELEVKLWQDDKERAGVFAQIGRIYAEQLADPERAMQFYESALVVDPECLPANQALFEYHFAEGLWDKALPIANALAQKAMRDGDPNTRSDFYRKRGVVSRMTGDPRAAAESFIVALEIRPTNADALDDLGSLARERPDVWDFDSTYRELEKLYKKRDDSPPLLARVHVGSAAILEREGDLDQAAGLYRQALELAPGDFTVLSALVEFHADMRHWREAIAAIERFVGSNAAAPADRIRALMRQASILADGEMDATRAVAVLREVIKLEPSHQDAYYLLAQEYYLAARYNDARTAIDRVIELATAPGQPLTPAALARYYYYKGRILDASGDARTAAPQYRRAIEYDPGYAPPALVLARRAADGGDQRNAESLLIEAAHAAMAQGGPRAAVPLQRGLARILLASGDRPAAIEAYRGILNVEPDGASDRVALAEIYAVDDPQRAISELRKVLDRDIHHAPAYRLLASFYSRLGDTERAQRVLTALDLLGFAEEADRSTMQRIRATRIGDPLRRTLDDDGRNRLLVTSTAREPLGEVFDAMAEELSTLVAQPSLGQNLQPALAAGEPRLQQLGAEIGGLFGVDAEIFVGEKVPGLVAVTAFPRRLLVVDRSLLAENDLSLRFLFGYALESIRGGYAMLLQLGARARKELANLLRALLSPDADLTGPAAELVNHASSRAGKILESHAGVRDVDAGGWIDGMLAQAKRAGLLACDDFHAAIWMVARLSGERLASADATVALGAVLGGPDLVRFYLSDAYQQLRDLLTV
jgi:tetratricopeptide (TPR) repeat protein